MSGSGAGRPPLLADTFGDGVLEKWREEGVRGDPRELEGAETWELVPVALEPKPGLRGPVVTRERLRELKVSLDPEDPSRLPEDWASVAAGWRAKDRLVQMPAHRGFFLSMGVHDWPSFEIAVEAAKEDPELVRDVFRTHRDFLMRLAERVMRDVHVDLASFSEPISTTHGPLISPRMYADYCLATYRPLVEHLKDRGVAAATRVTFSNARVLVPGATEAGFNCLWAYETGGEAMDYSSLRAECGADLKLIGGIDLDAVVAGEAALLREVEEKAAPLLAGGGYIPLADGRIRNNVPYANYARYRRALREAAGASAEE